MTYLKDFLEAQDFRAAVDLIGSRLRERYGLPAVYQLGLVVPDARAADEAMVAAGVPCSFLVKVKTDRWLERGSDATISATLGLAYHEGYELELIEPGQNAGFYAQDLDPQGDIIVHHFGFLVHDLDDWVARLAGQGVPLLVRGRLSLGPVTGNFAYFDTREEGGMITELICMQLLGIHIKLPQALVRRLAGYQVRTGKRCLAT